MRPHNPRAKYFAMYVMLVEINPMAANAVEVQKDLDRNLTHQFKNPRMPFSLSNIARTPLPEIKFVLGGKVFRINKLYRAISSLVVKIDSLRQKVANEWRKQAMKRKRFREALRLHRQ